MKLPVTAVINTLNEEKNIENALKSLYKWCDQIVIVDMYSDDQTRRIGKAYGAEIYLHERMGFADPARAYAISKAKNQWIIMLDADEVVPLSLSKKLSHILLADLADVVIIPWRNYIIGKHIEYSGWGGHEDKHARFFKKDFMDVSGRVHGFLTPKLESRIMELENTIENHVYHFNYININQFVSKMNAYTDKEADNLKEKNTFLVIAYVILRPMYEVLRRIFVNKSFRDGWRGVILSFMMGFYKFLVGAKAIERRINGDSENISVKYYNIAKKVTEEYER